MIQNIIFKSINDNITIIVNDRLNFDEFILSLKEKLERLYIKEDLLKTNVILDIKNIKLDPKKILNIFDVLAIYGNIYVSKIIYNQTENKQIILHEGNIRGGEIRLFATNTLIVGNINKGAKVIVNGNLYVIGKVNGTVEFKNINNKLMCSSINEAFVKICSIEKNVENLKDNVIIKLGENEIVEEKFMDRGEKIYGKSNCSYIW